MKAWLARAVANTVLRGEQPQNRLARWGRWYPATPTVVESRFQSADEPYPRHWRTFPDAWSPEDLVDPNVRDTLASAIAELPRPWRDVLIARDVLERSAVEVSEQQGLTPDQQRAILNRARATLREHLAQRFARRGYG
jgi:DNA-directed RNA polymerase specialized sigma24 family protein